MDDRTLSEDNHLEFVVTMATARKFGRLIGPRQAMLRNLVTDLILHDRITTTAAKGNVDREQ